MQIAYAPKHCPRCKLPPYPSQTYEDLVRRYGEPPMGIPPLKTPNQNGCIGCLVTIIGIITLIYLMGRTY
jgi:hypothetical protein